MGTSVGNEVTGGLSSFLWRKSYRGARGGLALVSTEDTQEEAWWVFTLSCSL